jgi:uncharacterized protein (TIGR03067 family)
MSRGCWPLMVALAVPVAAAAFPPVPKPKDKAAAKDLRKALQGTWEVVKIERGSSKVGLPKGYVLRMTIDGEKLTQTTSINGREGRSVLQAFVVDTKQRPAPFELTYTLGKAREVKIRGILTVEGDRMIWAYATGEGARPTKIDADPGAMQHRFTFKRVKP